MSSRSRSSSAGVAQVGPADRAMLDTVMEQRGGHRVGVGVVDQLGGDAADMVDERQACLGAVITVGPLREQIGFDHRDH